MQHFQKAICHYTGHVVKQLATLIKSLITNKGSLCNAFKLKVKTN